MGVNESRNTDEFFPVQETEADATESVDPGQPYGSSHLLSDSDEPETTETAAPVPSSTPSTTPHYSPRPIARRHSTQRSEMSERDDLVAVLKAQIVQDGLRRDDERRQREEERQLQCELQEEEAKRHERFMEMMMFMFCRGNNTSEMNKNSSKK